MLSYIMVTQKSKYLNISVFSIKKMLLLDKVISFLHVNLSMMNKLLNQIVKNIEHEHFQAVPRQRKKVKLVQIEADFVKPISHITD